MAIYGFLMAAEEFRKSEAMPLLDLFLCAEGGVSAKEASLVLPAGADVATRAITMAVRNDGRALARWCMVRFTVRLDLVGSPILDALPPSRSCTLS